MTGEPNWVAGLVTAVLGAGGVGAFLPGLLAYLRERRKPPAPAGPPARTLPPAASDDLVVIKAQEVLDMQSQLAQRVWKQMEQMEARFLAQVATLRADLDEARRMYHEEHATSRAQTHRIEAWEDFYADLGGRWWTHRQLEWPPDPPYPQGGPS